MCCRILTNLIVSDYFESPAILLKGALTGENCVTQTNTLLPVEMNFVDLILQNIQERRRKMFWGNICSTRSHIEAETDSCYWFIPWQEMSAFSDDLKTQLQSKIFSYCPGKVLESLRFLEFWQLVAQLAHWKDNLSKRLSRPGITLNEIKLHIVQ